MDLYKSWVDWIYSLSNIELALSFILPLLAFGGVGLLIFDRWLRRWFFLSAKTNDVLAFIGQIVGVSYGILVGLTAIACWDNFEEVQGIISKETTEISVFHRLSQSLDEGTGNKIRNLDIKYLDQVANSDWPSHAVGSSCDSSLLTLNEIFKNLATYEPLTKSDGIVFSKMLDTFNRIAEMRQERINQALDLAVPEVFWVVVLIGGYLTQVMILFVDIPSLITKHLMMAIFSVMMGMMYFLIAAIDNPFKGEVHVSSEPYIQLKRALSNDL